MHTITRGVVFLVLSAVPAHAQGAPGTNITLDVSAILVARRGDTTEVQYRLTNRPTSQERLFVFTVEAPAEPIDQSSPTPDDSWRTSLRYGDRAVVRWGALADSILQPGTSSQVLSFRALGLPAIVDAHAEGYYDLPVLSEDDPELDNLADPLAANSVPLKVVGIEPVPVGATPSSLTTRLDNLTGQACTLGWITQPALCTTLHGHLTAQPARLASFRDELAAGHTPGGPVSDNAYWLLKVNADYVISLIPGPVTPTLNWAPPAPIVFGTPLSSTQLNAVAVGSGGAQIPGTFAYTPVAGTVLNPGAAQTLSVVFTPSDQSSYTAASTSIPIDVRYNTAVGHRFMQPINTPPQDRSVFKLGSTIPVKFELFHADGATRVATAVATLQVNRLSNGAPDPINETIYSTTPDEGTNFRYTGTHYQFNLGTGTLSTGTYRLTALLDDGSRVIEDIELRSN